jgi:NADH pyrophosphatase NudC (nudix superfamily)
MSAVTQRIGTRIGARISARAVGRWVPIVLAPVFGIFSKSMTEKIGQEAVELFSKEIEIVAAGMCSSGHDVDPDANFCPQCGEKMKDTDAECND